MEYTIALIIPTLNERENIIDVLKSFQDAVKNIEIIIADSSNDGTPDIVKNAFKQDDTVTVLDCKRLGRGQAILEGYKWILSNTDTDIIATADADLSHDPSELTTLIKKLDEADFVIGSRYMKGGESIGRSIGRTIFSELANIAAGLVLGREIKDYTNGYRVMKREVIESIDLNMLDADGFIMLSQEIALVRKQGWRIAEVPTKFVDRVRGKSNFKIKLVFEAVKVLIVLGFKSKRDKKETFIAEQKTKKQKSDQE